METNQHLKRFGKLGGLGAAVVAIAGLAIFPSTSESFSSQPSTISESNDATEMDWRASPDLKEILILDLQLRDRDCVTRHQACERLRKIGPPIIKVWQVGRFLNLRETYGLKCQILVDIQKKYGPQPICANGLELLASTDQVWKMPPPGEQQEIPFSLKLLNQANKAIKISRRGTFSLELVEIDGKHLDSIPKPIGAPRESILLAPRQQRSISDFNFRLSRSKDGNLSLCGNDGRCIYYYPGLYPGRYYVWLRCVYWNNDWNGAEAPDCPGILSECNLPPIIIEIK